MRIALALAAPMFLCAALALPADAATGTASAPTRFAGPPAHAASRAVRAAHGRSSRAKRSRCSRANRDRAARKRNCRPTAKRTNARPVRARKLRMVSNVERRTSSSEAAAVQAASIAQALATPCQNVKLTPTPANLALAREAVLCLINTERAQHGEQPLLASHELEVAAESHGREMLALNYFDHVSPSGETPVDRVREAGWFPDTEVGYVVGENLAWGTLSLSTPEAIVNAWIASPEHLANILEAKYHETGIDVEAEVPQKLAEGVEGGLYTQEFGVIVH
ncbi:MAG: CAP domain-containing protein [Solirubrobacterales bacterium]